MELAVTNSCKKKINIIIYFENKFHIFYILYMHVKFYTNRIYYWIYKFTFYAKF